MKFMYLMTVIACLIKHGPLSKKLLIDDLLVTIGEMFSVKKPEKSPVDKLNELVLLNIFPPDL